MLFSHFMGGGGWLGWVDVGGSWGNWSFFFPGVNVQILTIVCSCTEMLCASQIVSMWRLIISPTSTSNSILQQCVKHGQISNILIGGPHNWVQLQSRNVVFFCKIGQIELESRLGCQTRGKSRSTIVIRFQ